LYKYDFKGKLIHKGTVATKEDVNVYPLSDTDIDKLWHVFDSKATSYKYFWFLSILQLFKEKGESSIMYKDVLVKMVLCAWRYVFFIDCTFPQIDQLPYYLETIDKKIESSSRTKGIVIDKIIDKYYNKWDLGSLLSPLLKNVPYRFLSPWIPFTSNNDVIALSNQKEAKCLYSLQDDYITINPMWSEFLLENYDKIALFIEKELRLYLKCK
jgi:hypothetical protein